MSSTNRGGIREVSDYYKTPEKHIINFLHAWSDDDCNVDHLLEYKKILDPCVGKRSLQS